MTNFTVSYPTLNDSILENPETTELEIGGVTGTGTIIDAGNAIPVVSIAATIPQATEGVGDSIVFTVSQTGVTDKDSMVKVKLDLPGGIGGAEATDILDQEITFTDTEGNVTIYTVAQAVAGIDVTIPAGATNNPTFSITPTNDDIYEQSESLGMSISNAVNATVSSIDNNVTGTITDNDTAPIAIVNPATVEEGGFLDMQVDLSNPSDSITTVSLTLADGSATLGTDTTTPVQVSVDGGNTFTNVFVDSNGDFSVDIPANSTAGIIVRVPTVDDTIDEADETISLTASAPGQTTPSTGIGTILDNDDAPVINITGPAIIDEAAGTVSYEVTLSNPSSSTVTVDYATADIDTTAGLDYTAISGTLSFIPGVTSQTITVAITDDSLFESAEDYSVNLSNPSNATINVGQVITTITELC